jgi:hypothetical protein
MILVGRHRAFNESLLRTSLTTWDFTGCQKEKRRAKKGT